MLRGLFDVRLPHRRITLPNPAFEYELYRSKPPRFQAELFAVNARIMLWTHGIGWGIAILALLLNRAQSGGWLMLVCALAILGAGCASDINAVGMTLNHNEDWDLLRLTLLDRNALIDAAVAGGQIRAWRMLSLDSALRFLGIELLVFLGLNSLPPIRGFSASPAPLIAGQLVATFLGIGLTAVALFLEPYWRQRSLVYVALWLSMDAPTQTNRFLSALMVILAMLLARIAGFGAMLLICLQPVFTIRAARYLAFGRSDMSFVLLLIRWSSPALIVCGLTLGLFWCTRAVERFASRRIHAALHDEGDSQAD